MTWRDTVAEMEYDSGRMRRMGGGDDDVYTKPGRTTEVVLTANQIRPAEDWKSILVDVHYSVRELASNYTFLDWRDTARVPILIDAQKGRMQLMDVTEFNRRWQLKGQYHEPMELTNLGNSVITSGTYRIDGPGPDLDNAHIHLQLRVPIKFDDAS